MDDVLTADGLWKTFGRVTALQNVSLRIPRGSLYSLLGPNGSGKSTLLGLASGLMKPSQGSIRVLDQDPFKKLPTLAQKIGIAFDDHTLPRWATGKKFLSFAAKLKGFNNHKKEAEKAAEHLGVTEYWRREIRTYSAGMYKKLVLSQALLGDPDLLLLDEPAGNLDAGSKRTLRGLMVEKVKEGHTVIIASHMLGEVQDSSHLAIMLNGRVVTSGRVSELALKDTAVATVVETSAPEEAVRVLLEVDVHPLTVEPGRLEVPVGRDQAIETLKVLDGRGIPYRVAEEKVDIFRIYKIALALEAS
ncbi:MAG: ABC transporter ATP-binding protein [Candidatus Geothermarchaeales archaeon]